MYTDQLWKLMRVNAKLKDKKNKRGRPPTVLFDVVYDPWPTALAAAAERAGCAVVSGLDLLLAQGVRQFELFTGVPAPVEAMRAALETAAAARTSAG